MNIRQLRGWLARFFGVFHRKRREREFAEELEGHLALHIEDNLRAGMSPEEARRRALLKLGGVTLTQELYREQKELPMLETLLQDLRFGLRMLRKNPGFSLAAILTLALGIGATAGLFSLFNAVLFRALPYPDSDRLVRVFKTLPQSQAWPHPVAGYFDQKAQNTVFEHMAAFNQAGFDLAEPGQPPEPVRGMVVSADFFPVLGVQPLLGRVFTAEEDQPGRNQVVVLSHSFWRDRFTSDPKIVGRTLRLDAESVTVLGVMPAGFDHPPLWGKVDAWRPIAFTNEQRQERKVNTVRSLARLKPGVSLMQAQSEMSALAARLAQEYSDHDAGVRIVPLKESATGAVGRNIALFALGLSGFVLLIACVNLANLQLARTAERAREYVIRAALGAQRSRLLRQSLTESLLLALMGGTLGLLLAVWLSGSLGRRLVMGDQVGITIPLDSTVMVFAMLMTLVTGVAFGAAPAWIGSRANVGEALKQNNRGTTAGRSHHRLRHGLIVVEVALALVLLTGAGVFISGLYRFTHSDPGWRVEGLLTGVVNLPDKKYDTKDSRNAYYERLQARLATLPGIEHAAISWQLPLWGFPIGGGFAVEGQAVPPHGAEPTLSVNRVSPGYFDTLGMRLIEGRDFLPTDTAISDNIVIINEAMARRFWPGESAVGKRFGHLDPKIPRQEIVGVVSNARFAANLLSEPETRYQVYEPLRRKPEGQAVIALRSPVPPETLVNVVRRAVAEIDPDQPVRNLQPTHETIERSLVGFSLISTILLGFALLGLLLAAVGIYGVMAGFIVQRTGEIGIRVALGAQMRDILWLVLGKGLRLTLLGAGIGLVGAIIIARLLAAAVPALSARDPWAIALVAALLIVVALVACWLPARRAAKTDPMTVLRLE